MSKRDQMPTTTEFVDAARLVFGAVEVNASIRAGIAGKPTFYAAENGQVIGTKAPPSDRFMDGTPIDPSWNMRKG